MKEILVWLFFVVIVFGIIGLLESSLLFEKNQEKFLEFSSKRMIRKE